MEPKGAIERLKVERACLSNEKWENLSVNRRIKFKFVSSISLIATALSIFTSTAQAVTNGSLVPSPKDDAPYVVSIWNSENSNDYKDADFICTGTLIAPQIVLTAAHCTTYTTSYFVKVGAGALNDSTGFTAVTAVWPSPRYNPKTFVNDIGLLKLAERFENISFPTLANSFTAKKITKFSNLRIFGWGLDQNRNLADLLRTSNLLTQDASAVKTFGKDFNATTMISAGRRIPAENVWSGACNGDSGGPLLSTIDGINVIVGVTSWGAKRCLPNKPSIFARVSYYEKEVKKGIKDIEALSVSVSRTAPIAIEEPTITPENPIPGSKLKCSPGKWKNASSITTTWISPSRLLGSTSSEISVLSSDGGAEFKCEVVASIANASVRRVLRASIIGNSVLSGTPEIAGIDERVTIKPGQMAMCEGWNWKIPVDSERVTWFTSAASQPSVPVNGRQIGSGSSITFDSNMLKNENGRYLICQVTGVKNGFESHFTTSKYITTPSAPVLSSIYLNAYSLTNGSTATCEYKSSGEIDTTRIEWGYTSIAGYFTQYPGLSGSSIQINSRLAQEAAGKYLACKITLINSGGEVSKSANTSSSFERLPNTPTASTRISGAVVAGNTAYCSSNAGYVSGSTISFAWGKTSAGNSKFIERQVLSNNDYYTITSDTLSDLASAFLTCVVTVTNSVGSSSAASSIAIPATSVTLPTPSAPSVEAQTASNTSITTIIRIPSITGFNSSTMNAVLNVINSAGCSNLSITPDATYSCSGLSGNTTYTANISISAKTGISTTTRSSNLSFTTIGLTSVTLPTPSAPSVEAQTASNTSITTIIRIPSITGFNSSTMNAVLNVINSAGCSNLSITPDATYSCSGLSGNTTYTANISISAKTGISTTTRSSNLSFTTIGLTNATLYVCGQSCSGTLTSLQMEYYLSDKRLTEASSAPGGPITSSTCVGSGCNSGTAPALPVSCSAGSSERTGIAANATAQITTQFRYCSAPTDTTAPIIGSGTLAYTGYAPIIPISGAAGASISVRFIATDNIGIANTSVRLINPGNVVVASASGSFIAGGTRDGVYSATIATASSGPLSGDVYQIQVQARDASGNSSAWFNLGSYTISSTGTGLTPTFGARTPDYHSPGFKYQIANYDPSYTWIVTSTVGSASINSSGLASVINVAAKQSATLTVTTSKTGYTTASASVTSVAPWDLSDEIQTQNITATLSGTTLTVNVPNANGWTWGLNWDNTQQKTNITSFPYTLTGFSTNKNIQLYATDNLYNYGYSRVFLPTVITPPELSDTELPKLISNSGSVTSASMSQGALGISTNENFTVNFRATDDIGITFATMYLDTSCCENIVQQVFLSTSSNLISGTSKDGVYSATALFPGKSEMQSLRQSWSQGGSEDLMKGCGMYYIRIRLSDSKNSSSWLTLGTINVVKCEA